MPFFEHSGASIYYETIGGDGPWIVLVNGHTRTAKDFRAFSRHLERCGARILTMDNRGSGLTVYDGTFTLEVMVGDLLALVGHLEIASFSLLGISMGGMIAQRFAVTHQELVDRLVLVSTAMRRRCLRSSDLSGSRIQKEFQLECLV